MKTARNWALDSGERQVATTFDAIRADHRARYEWAASRLHRRDGQQGVDIFCGTGYGTKYLAEQTGMWWLGIDGSEDAVDFAEQHFAHDRVAYTTQQFPFPLPEFSYEAIVAFESIEHVDDASAFLAMLAKALVPGGALFLSTPNEALCPAAAFRNAYHVRHYTMTDVVTEATSHGLSLVAWCGQYPEPYGPGTRTDGTMHPNVEGQHLTFHFVRVA